MLRFRFYSLLLCVCPIARSEAVPDPNRGLYAIWTRPEIFRIWAVCDVDNPASARVMEKAGMQREGRLASDRTTSAIC